MPTKAQLQEELESYKQMYINEVQRTTILHDQIRFLKDFSIAGHIHHMVDALAKMSHALRKATELEKTGKSTGF